MEGSSKHESSQVDILFCGWEFQTSSQCISMSWLFPRLPIYIIFFTHATLHNPSLLVACWLLLPLLLSSQKPPHPQPVGSMPCSSAITSQNLAPIWLPHCPPERKCETSNRLQQKGIHIWHKHVPKLWALTSKGFLLTYISLKIWELRHSHSFILFEQMDARERSG